MLKKSSNNVVAERSAVQKPDVLGHWEDISSSPSLYLYLFVIFVYVVSCNCNIVENMSWFNLLFKKFLIF